MPDDVFLFKEGYPLVHEFEIPYRDSDGDIKYQFIKHGIHWGTETSEHTFQFDPKDLPTLNTRWVQEYAMRVAYLQNLHDHMVGQKFTKFHGLRRNGRGWTAIVGN